MSCKDLRSVFIPVLKEDEVFSNDCKRTEGGTPSIGTPFYALKVTNPDKNTECVDFLTDEDGTVIVDDDGETIDFECQ